MAADPEFRKVLILVEGQTEEAFIKNVLAGHLTSFSLTIIPVIARTKRTESGTTFKGGLSTYYRIEKQLLNLLADSSAQLVTTMLDYYAFPVVASIPRPSGASALSKAQSLEKAIEQEIGKKHQGNPDRFRAYLSLHEYEALLFSEINAIAGAMGPDRIEDLAAIVRQFEPEDINDNPTTCPSARLSALFPNYKKRVDGPTIARAIGIDTIRRSCPHFNQWLAFVEAV